MKYRLLIQTILIALVCTSSLSAADNITLWSLSYTEGTKITHFFRYSVPPAHLDALRNWEPSQQPVPLPPEKAFSAAIAWAQSHIGEGITLKVDEISLQRGQGGLGKWIYVVTFSTDPDSKLFEKYLHAVVLFDGTVVEPTEQPGEPPSFIKSR